MIYVDSMEDRHWARKLNEYLDQESDPEYMYPPEIEIETWGRESSFEFGYAYIRKSHGEIYTSGYFVDTRFYAEEEKEFYTEKYWRRA